MDCTTFYPKISEIQVDFPEFEFKTGEKFSFLPPRTIILGPDCPNFMLLALHELAHAVLEHKDYNYDIELVRLESEAWERAKGLCEAYEIEYDEEFVQDTLDSYREWLYKRSTCSKCGVNGIQGENGVYKCPHCFMKWTARGEKSIEKRLSL
jgi:hypothetical protein